MFEKINEPDVEIPVAKEEKEMGELAVSPEGRIITKEEAKEELKRREDDPNWIHEQK